jgi:hypothetical protein
MVDAFDDPCRLGIVNSLRGQLTISKLKCVSDRNEDLDINLKVPLSDLLFWEIKENIEDKMVYDQFYRVL